VAPGVGPEFKSQYYKEKKGFIKMMSIFSALLWSITVYY
jgi:hypothetical protein